MKNIARYFSFVITLGYLLSNHPCCVRAFGIDDQSQDLAIQERDLPKHITRVFKARAEDLTQQIHRFSYGPTKNYIIFEQGDLIFNVSHVSEDEAHNNYILREFVEDLQRAYKVFTKPQLFSISSVRFDLNFEVNPGSLTILFGDVASEFSIQYGHIVQTRSLLTRVLKEKRASYLDPNFVLPHLLGAMLDIRNKTLQDLSTVIHAVRPHIPLHKVPLPLQAHLQTIEQGLKKIASEERKYLEEALDLARKVSDNPDVRQMLAKNNKQK